MTRGMQRDSIVHTIASNSTAYSNAVLIVLSLLIGSSAPAAAADDDETSPSTKPEAGFANVRARPNTRVVGENDQPRCGGEIATAGQIY